MAPAIIFSYFDRLNPSLPAVEMFCTVHEPAYGCLFIKHFGAFEKAQGQVACIEALTLMSIGARRACTQFLLDLRDVSSATLEDTDRAKQGHTERRIAGLLGLTPEDAKRHIDSLKFVLLVDQDNPSTEVLLQRWDASQLQQPEVESGVAEALLAIGLPPDYQIQYPNVGTKHGNVQLKTEQFDVHS